VEHIVPESLGNDDLLLVGEVCDGCQRYLGKEVEQYVLSKTPIGVWRTFLGIRTKKGKLPHVDLTVPTRPKGTVPEWSPRHDNGIGFTAHEDGSTSVNVDDTGIVREIVQGQRREFRFVLSPKHLVQMGRFLGKIGVELLCSTNPTAARSDRYADLRRYVRYGIKADIWPIFHTVSGELPSFRKITQQNDSVAEEVFCYEYELLSVGDLYDVFRFQVGSDSWSICMNDPFPTPVIREAFPKSQIELIWYSQDEWQKPK
jgi:cold shock CspA family protein